MTDQEIWDNDSIMAANGLHAQLPMERLKPLVNTVAAPLLERIAALEAQVEQAAQPVYQVKQAVGASVWCDVSRAEFDEAAYFGVTKRVLYTSLPKAAPLTDEQILAGAHAMNKLECDVRGIDEEDSWKLYGNSYIIDAATVLRAANGIKKGGTE